MELFNVCALKYLLTKDLPTALIGNGNITDVLYGGTSCVSDISAFFQDKTYGGFVNEVYRLDVYHPNGSITLYLFFRNGKKWHAKMKQPYSFTMPSSVEIGTVDVSTQKINLCGKTHFRDDLTQVTDSYGNNILTANSQAEMNLALKTIEYKIINLVIDELIALSPSAVGNLQKKTFDSNGKAVVK